MGDTSEMDLDESMCRLADDINYNHEEILAIIEGWKATWPPVPKLTNIDGGGNKDDDDGNDIKTIGEAIVTLDSPNDANMFAVKSPFLAGSDLADILNKTEFKSGSDDQNTGKVSSQTSMGGGSGSKLKEPLNLLSKIDCELRGNNSGSFLTTVDITKLLREAQNRERKVAAFEEERKPRRGGLRNVVSLLSNRNNSYSTSNDGVPPNSPTSPTACVGMVQLDEVFDVASHTSLSSLLSFTHSVRSGAGANSEIVSDVMHCSEADKKNAKNFMQMKRDKRGVDFPFSPLYELSKMKDLTTLNELQDLIVKNQTENQQQKCESTEIQSLSADKGESESPQQPPPLSQSAKGVLAKTKWTTAQIYGMPELTNTSPPASLDSSPDESSGDDDMKNSINVENFVELRSEQVGDGYEVDVPEIDGLAMNVSKESIKSKDSDDDETGAVLNEKFNNTDNADMIPTIEVSAPEAEEASMESKCDNTEDIETIEVSAPEEAPADAISEPAEPADVVMGKNRKETKHVRIMLDSDQLSDDDRLPAESANNELADDSDIVPPLRLQDESNDEQSITEIGDARACPTCHRPVPLGLVDVAVSTHDLLLYGESMKCNATAQQAIASKSKPKIAPRIPPKPSQTIKLPQRSMRPSTINNSNIGNINNNNHLGSNICPSGRASKKSPASSPRPAIVKPETPKMIGRPLNRGIMKSNEMKDSSAKSPARPKYTPPSNRRRQ